jgi:hypothetical protein
MRQRHDNGVTQGARLIEEASRLGEETVSPVDLWLAVRVIVHAASFSDLAKTTPKCVPKRFRNVVEHRAPLSDDENFHRHPRNKIDGWR